MEFRSVHLDIAATGAGHSLQMFIDVRKVGRGSLKLREEASRQ